MRRVLLPRKRGLAFPVGCSPGFDPNHPCAKNTRLSAVFDNGSFTNLDSSDFAPNFGTIAGTVGKSTDGIIGASKAAGTTYKVSFATAATVNADCTLAAIIRTPTALADGGILQNSNGAVATGNALFFDHVAGHLYFINSGNSNDSGVALALNTPYLVLLSSSSTNNYNVVVRNLQTGKITTAVVSSGGIANDLGSGFIVGFETFFSSYFTGKVACVAYQDRYFSMSQLLFWADDPWKFWYPRPTIFEVGVVTASGGTPLNQNAVLVQSLPNLPTPFNQSWLCDTTYLISKDSLPFRQRYWPNPNIPVYYDDYSWDDFFSLSLIGQDKLPTGKQRTDVPYGPIPPVRDWIEYTVPAGQDKLPVGDQRWAVPYGPIPPVRDWVDYLNPPAFPLVSIRTEVPLSPWSNPFWVSFLNPPGFPNVSTRGEVPLGPTTNPFWINYTLPFNYPVVVSTTPNVSVVWFVPSGPIPKVSDWQDYIIPAGQDRLPVGEQRFNVPAGPPPNPYWVYYLNPPGFPLVQQRDEVPYGPPPNPFWVSYLNPPSFPTVSIRTEVPYGPPPNPFWIDYVIPAGQDSLPTRQYVYDVPKGPVYPDQTFYQYVQPQAVVFFPEVGQVYFVPVGAIPKVSDYQSYIIPAGQDKLPLNQYNWPVPKGATPGQDWQLLYNNALNFVVQPGPPGVLFNQYSWPNPIILSIGNLDWQNFLTNIPQPSPVELISSGRYLTEADVEASKHVKWRYKEGADILYKHMAAVNLGRKGGIQSGKSRRSR